MDSTYVHYYIYMNIQELAGEKKCAYPAMDVCTDM